MSIRTYQPSDKASAITLIRVNTPAHFDPSEEKLFSQYLDEGVGDMFVYERDGEIIGCASINYDSEYGILSWAMVHPKYHHCGIGTKLVEHRVNHIKSKGYKKIIVRTSQLTFQFYEKMGFVLELTEKDYWAKGYDLYYMQKAF